MESKWFLTMIRDEFRGGKINVDKTYKLLEKLSIPCNYIHVKSIFKANDRLKQGRITIEEFRSIYRIMAHREEIIEIFNTYSENQKFLFEKNLLQFLIQEQYALDMTKNTAFEIIQKYEPIEEVKRAHQMSFEGFIRYMGSPECLIFKTDCGKVYQDMNHPLNDYFISSSHNTYLVSDQLLGPSDLWGYISALVKGCRCLEIDCWDGSRNEPVVYHGYTLTSKLLFKTVIQAIEKYAFLTSDYPVVLSLENHCSPPQQEVMADILQCVFGDSLLSDMLDDFPDKLPSPEVLKFKILVRNKKIGSLMETRERKGSDKHGQVAEYEEIDQDVDDEVKASKSLAVLEDNSEERSDTINVAGLPLFRRRRVKVAMALSDLVIYTKAEKFRSFQYSRLYQQFNESNSIGESEARKLLKLKAHEFILHTRMFITRIYPKAMRADSSNFNPQEFWNIGCQMVALNFQTPGLPMDLQNGKFLDNGGSGYILKPHFLRDIETQFDPNETPRDTDPVTLTIRLISGIQLPPSNNSSSNKANTLVILEIFGVPDDHVRQQTRVIKKNGYRRVPLFSKMGESLEPAALFIYVWYVR
ncbi:1-phosphatidylinositol 4,5-bisphosphate phosphodiesterase zeta-1 isoform X3 [Lontra canadensis]|uniref:1-phosphatidylinositol 4,5-bisphosphate phosphodiesterase zeta-1 isoform X3 n=1 Tax=Lontra canadensis TaxID=76717 RepID=UPI0013F34E2F|nr:1-phosphatidylinositol 4,5-bisphosphate phosphodiesterase zeta-1 isoform X3 [Lontra canadensis]